MSVQKSPHFKILINGGMLSVVCGSIILYFIIHFYYKSQI